MEKGKSKKGVKRVWCKKKLQQLFNVLISSRNARVETTLKTGINSQITRLDKVKILYSTIILVFVAVRPASGMTPVIMVGNASETVAKVEKACTFLCKVALVTSKFVHTKEGRTAVMWLMCSGVAKGIQAMSLMAAPSYGSAAIGLAMFCSAAYGLEILIGGETFGGAEFLNQANKWCVQGYSILGAAAILPKDAINVAIKLLEGVKTLS